jgi:hypothetical protein
MTTPSSWQPPTHWTSFCSSGHRWALLLGGCCVHCKGGVGSSEPQLLRVQHILCQLAEHILGIWMPHAFVLSMPPPPWWPCMTHPMCHHLQHDNVDNA